LDKLWLSVFSFQCIRSVLTKECACVCICVDGKGNFVNKVLDIEDLVTLGQKLKYVIFLLLCTWTHAMHIVVET